MNSAKSNLKSVLAVYYQNKIVSTIDLDHGSSKKSYTLGRALDNDITINSPIVSGHHAIFEIVGDKCIIKDSNSTNGIYVNGTKVGIHELSNGDNIRIDDLQGIHDKGVLIVYSLLDSSNDERWSEYELHSKEVINIGRDSSNNIVINHSSASKHHARIYKNNGAFIVEDLGSTNGTFINGSLINSKTSLNLFDVIIIGNTKIIFKGDRLVYNILSKGLRLDAIHISKVVKDSSGGFFGSNGEKKILDDISISIKPGELVALVGGSGAGKSTFMDSLNGFRLPTEGSVLVNDDDFYTNYNAYKNILGYVPQQDIVYDTLTVEQMLIYAAKLRMPEDTTDEELRERVAEVIKNVELEGRENLLIKQLSGGQKKRASIAVELLADPKLFYLDEPTSGLDPGMERNMMQLLRKLADSGKTIIIITHATANLHLCDKVVILGYGGKLCYFGPPKGALEFFEVEDFADIYDLITKESLKWQQRYKDSDYATYQKQLNSKSAKSKSNHKVANRSSLKQFLILSSRYLKLTLMDKQRVLLLIAQAPLIALLLSLVARKDAFSYYETSKEIIFTLACAGVWLGVLNSIQEVCKEKAIYKRERAVNLKLAPYIFSKLLILGILCLIQTLLLILVLFYIIDLPDVKLIINLKVELAITLFLVNFAATTMGLAISTLVSNTDRAMGLAPMILIPQLLFTGLVFQLKNIANFVANFAISKWASRALSITFDLNNIPLEIEAKNPKLPIPPRDLPEYLNHQLDLLLRNWMILGIFIFISITVSLFLLKSQDDQ